jgi:hypothetical protein
MASNKTPEAPKAPEATDEPLGSFVPDESALNTVQAKAWQDAESVLPGFQAMFRAMILPHAVTASDASLMVKSLGGDRDAYRDSAMAEPTPEVAALIAEIAPLEEQIATLRGKMFGIIDASYEAFRAENSDKAAAAKADRDAAVKRVKGGYSFLTGLNDALAPLVNVLWTALPKYGDNEEPSRLRGISFTYNGEEIGGASKVATAIGSGITTSDVNDAFWTQTTEEQDAENGTVSLTVGDDTVTLPWRRIKITRKPKSASN